MSGATDRNGSTPLEDYALLGDRRTAALVSRAGSIDWWCVPRFDAPACFAALLGERDDGRFLLGPVGPADAIRRYRGDTMVLETEHRSAQGRVRVVDCLVRDTPEPTLVRVVEGLEGSVEMQAELVVRFDYGSIVPWVRRVDGVWRAVGGPDALELRSPVRLHGVDQRSVGTFMVRRGDHVPFVLRWLPSHRHEPLDVDAEAVVARTRAAWTRWSRRCTYRGKWRAEVMRSLLTLEALAFAETGGIVAAPTTSLPEVLGGTRNWDYRYCWVRDATLTLEAFLIGGYQREARRWREWLLRAVAGSPDMLQTLYGLGGERRLTEIEIDWLPGYGGSRPVRIGNAAHAQLQLDVYGELLDVLWQSTRAGARLSGDSWSMVQLLLEELETRWREPDEGIWEVRGPRQHFTHSKVLCWVAFDRGVAMIEHDGRDGPHERWRRVRDDIHAEVCDRAFDRTRNAFVQSYESDCLDASVLMIPLVGFLPPDDPRVVSTIDALRRDLTEDGLVLRYDPASHVDGIGEGEGVFLPCSFWMVEALALAGRVADAERLFDHVLSIANDVGLFAEEYDTRAGAMRGNFPQAFTHLALVGAAHTLEPSSSAAARRRTRPGARRRARGAV